MILPFSFLQYRLLAMIPTMTSNTTPSGVASTSDSSSSAWTAFTPSLQDGWQAPGTGGNWIQYQFPRPTVISRMTFGGGGVTNGSWTITVGGSNDGSSFSTITTFIMVVASFNLQTTLLDFANNTAYRYYRLTIASGGNMTFDAIQMYGF